ncbi:dihydroneopterin aldolase [Echinicola vietnamensis]|uniref:7,8-dihydroneopterin aldolase n=1 Tax=Echinicola vietnamensis (strain DSM 17526 / LMG 23754 / KMM 6221) TaxID=926556 RepID=L0FR27_ECHVK|nr:dihydroneopterin aldolase [Echinicola vietnamensis]AGA76404.1 dihydroneopterin aldolase [Echinicola vietnamensis DSM 17526]
MGKVSLEGIEFHAFHGVFSEEKKLGNRFTVDIHVETDFKQAMLEDDLNETVDYSRIYQIAKSHMEEPVKLLEHLAHLMLQDILKVYPNLESIDIIIKKHNPALGGVVNYSVVKVSYPADYE